MADNDLSEFKLYRLGQESRRSGLFGMPLQATMIGIAGVVIAMLSILQGSYVLTGFILVALVMYLVPAVIRIGSRSVFEVMQMRWQFWKASMRGETVYRSGPNSRIPGGHYRLPGVLAKHELHVGVDVAMNEFGMIRDPGLNQYTVILNASPRGHEPLTVEDENLRTADWGRWLADLSLSGDVVGATATIETFPTTGQELVQSVLASVDESAPDVARQIQADSAVEFTRNQLAIRGWCAITYKAKTTMQRKDPETMATEIGRRLPDLYERLSLAGVDAMPMTPVEVLDVPLRAYRPELEEVLTDLDLRGEDPGIGWEDAGPAFAKAHAKFYAHEDQFSKTFEMAAPPSGAFPSHVLQPLLEARSEVPRKRVTVTYRPFEAGEGAKRVEREYNDAENAHRKSNNQSPKAGAKVRLEDTEAARNALARGAQYGRYSLAATITVNDKDQLGPAGAVLGQLGNRSLLRMHSADYQQDIAFAATLGIGVFIHQKSTISSVAKAG